MSWWFCNYKNKLIELGFNEVNFVYIKDLV